MKNAMKNQIAKVLEDRNVRYTRSGPMFVSPCKGIAKGSGCRCGNNAMPGRPLCAVHLRSEERKAAQVSAGERGELTLKQRKGLVPRPVKHAVKCSFRPHSFAAAEVGCPLDHCACNTHDTEHLFHVCVDEESEGSFEDESADVETGPRS